VRTAARSHGSNRSASEPFAEAPSFAGTRLGPYELLAPLGVGGMAEVFRARDVRLGREVAVTQGRRDYDKTGEKEAVLTTREAETFSAPDCLTVVGWYRRALEMCGASAPRVVEEECRAKGGAACRCRLSWS